MPGTFPIHLLIEENLAGDRVAVFSDDIGDERSVSYARQSSTGRTAEGPANRDVYVPLHLGDELGPGVLVPDDRHVLHSAVFKYGHVTEFEFRSWLDRIRARPATRFWLIVWGQPRTYAWTGNGAAQELHLYQVMAMDAFEAIKGPLPGSSSQGTAETLEYYPRLWVEGDEIPLNRVDASTFAGPAPAGEAWWLQDGQRIKLGDVPPLRARIECRLLPLWRVTEDVGRDVPEQKRGRTSALEPRTLSLVEAQE